MSHRTVGRTDVELARELVDALLRAGWLISTTLASLHEELSEEGGAIVRHHSIT
jgi:hypothetical protein